MTSDLVIDARDIRVEYQTPAMRTSTLKEAVINRLRGKDAWLTAKALKGVSLRVRRGECVALIGHNGCGKSTFLKVLAGILKPVGGTLAVNGRVAPLIELGAGFDPELTGRENVFLSCSLMGLRKKEIEERLPRIREFAELGEFFDAPVKTYSSGMYMRLGFACTTAIDADLLLIDEVLAVGDENFQKKCVQRMKEVRQAGATVILVSHDLGVVARMADRVLVIHHGEAIFEGAAGPAIDAYHDVLRQEISSKLSPEAKAEQMRRQKLAVSDARDNAALKELGDAQVLKAQVFGHDGKDRVQSGKPWKLAIDIEVKKAFREAPTIGYAIHALSGIRLFGGNAKVHPAVGRHRVDFQFESNALASGEYTVIVAIHDHRIETTIDIKPDIVRLEVVDQGDPSNFDKDVIGPAWRKATVTVETSALP